MPADNYDRTVARTAYATAKGMGASDKVMLALFEAGIVESGFRNLNYGDRDSVGFLQQRPSQGWPNPMDVATATRSFVNKAKPIEHKYSTAGRLAQAVQVSAFPLKYDAVKVAAAAFLAEIAGSKVVPVENSDGGTFDNLGKAIKTLGDAGTWRRVITFLIGGTLILIAIVKMTGNNQLSPATKKLAKLATLVVTKKVPK